MSWVGQKPLLSEELNKSTCTETLLKLSVKRKCKGEEFMHQVLYCETSHEDQRMARSCESSLMVQKIENE